MDTILDYKPAGFFRRIAALFYDLILIIALCIGSILLITFFINTEILSPFMYLFFLVLSISFYCYFWKQNNGQTLGMQVWKIKLSQIDGADVKLSNMIARCISGLVLNLFFGINYLPMIFRKDKRTLNDILSKTVLKKI
jgi:uncharacterized RDD family membrane protein YckC